MSREELLGVGVLVRQLQIKLAGLGPMPASAIEEMAKITPDALVRSIVEDNRKAKGVPAPSGLLPDEPARPAPVRGSGWAKTQPLELPSGTKYVDQLCDMQDAI